VEFAEHKGEITHEGELTSFIGDPYRNFATRQNN